MEFRTEIKLPKAPFSLGLADGFVTVGSCFSDAIGERLHANKFAGLVNPIGTTYNPVSIHNLLLLAINRQAPRSDGYCFRDHVFFHHDFHSAFFHANKTELGRQLMQVLDTLAAALSSCRVLMITYGTAWVFEDQVTKQIVANCHKVPQAQFTKFLLTQKRILESFDNMLQALLRINPSIRVILTVSPVRHIKDTLELNSVSKAILRLSTHTLTQHHKQIVYFPSFEIMQDDLRDYRFYEQDLIHPSGMAIDYIWQKFSQAYFEADTQTFLKQWQKVKASLNHKAFNFQSDAHLRFLQNLEEELSRLSQFADLHEEMNTVRNQLALFKR